MPLRFNLPPITRLLLVTLLAQSVLSFAIRYGQWTESSDLRVPYMTLVPQLSLIYPWTFLTTTLVENNIFTLSITAVALLYGGRYLERAWSSPPFAKFLLIVSLIPNAICFFLYVTLYAITGEISWPLTTISGGIPLQSAFLVAFSQLVPAHTVTLFRGMISLRVPRFPLLYITLVTILAISPIMTSASFFLSMFGFITSWTYLRFYKPAFPDLETAQNANLRGDASETFAFSEFFPDPLKPSVSAFSNAVYQILVSIHVCTPWSDADVSASRGDSFVPRVTPGTARAEAERRRALALKALDQRLHAATATATVKTQTPPQSAPSGPSVQTQPTVAQNAMSDQAEGILGQTSYVPEGDERTS